MKNTFRELLSSRRFLPLFIVQSLGAFNDNFFRNALMILVSYQILSSFDISRELLIAILGGLFVLPTFIFSATAGQLADKYAKSRLLQIIKFAEIVIGLMTIVGFAYHSTFILAIALTLIAIQYAFFSPIKYGILPNLLTPDELVEGNGLVEASTFIAILIGTLVGGSLAIISQHHPVYLGIIITLIAVFGFIASMLVPRVPAGMSSIKINPNIVQETLNIVRYSTGNRQLWLAIFGISWFFLIGAILVLQFPNIAPTIIHGKAEIASLFLATFTIGIAGGALLCNRLLRNKLNNTYVPLGILGVSVFLFDFSSALRAFSDGNTLTNIGIFTLLSTLNGWRMVIDLLLLSIFGGLYIVPLYVTLQTLGDKAHIARIIAGNNIVNALFMVIGVAFVGILLLGDMSLTRILAIFAVLNTIIAIYVCGLIPDAVIKTFVKWLLRVLYKVEVHGLENYAAAGKRILIVANHTSYLDALLLAAFLPDKLTFAINREVAQALWVKLLLNLVNTFPIDPTNAMAAKSLIEELERDNPIMIFPEGRITVTGALMKVYEGPGLIADKANAAILPVRISGAQYSHLSRLKGRVRLKWRPKITLTVLTPQRFDIAEEIKGRERREILSKKLYDLMTYMLFESTEYKTTLFKKLLEAKRIHGGKIIALEDAERKPITYNRFILGAFVLGRQIIQRTSSNAPIGLLLPNAAATAIAFFGLHAYGRAPAMLNYTAGPTNMVNAIKVAAIELVVTSHRFIEVGKLEELIAAIKPYVKIIYLEDIRNQIKIWHKLWGMLQAKFAKLAYRHLAPQQDADDIAVILFTSGSEGTPKGVALSHKNLLANAAQTCAIVDFSGLDTVFNCLPVFHCFGLTGGMVLPLTYGLKCFLYPSPLHYRIIPELVYDVNATMMFGTDTFLAGYAEYAHPYDFYSVRYIFAGAEKLKAETRRIWNEKFGVRIFEGYGATETAPIISTNTPMHNRPGTVGRILPGMKFKVVPVPGIATGGELYVKGPNVMLGYYKMDKPGVLQLHRDEWYNTGDIVTVDEDDYITIIGRTKRFAKIAGEMISLTAVETFVAQHWPEFQHALVAIRDEHDAEELVLLTTAAIDQEAMNKAAKAAGLARVAVPKRIFTLEAIPLLGSGKTDYQAAMQLAVSLYFSN